jgi:NAD(P)-dependent dehydrogenase (short-subunit alcohol dehydrogenase family)
VNALVAGGFDTEMLQAAVSRLVRGDPAKIQEAFNGYAARVPAGRVGRPEKAAQAVLWLCSCLSLVGPNATIFYGLMRGEGIQRGKSGKLILMKL